jgi:DNA-binding IclR family transcriptional regulator
MTKSLQHSFASRDHVSGNDDAFGIDVADEADGRAASAPASVQTLERALHLLKAFAGEARSLSNADLVKKTGYSKASVSRITGTLVALRYLQRTPDGLRFQIGLRGLTLGHNYLASNAIHKLARPIMQSFADEFDVSVALGVADGLDMVYIEYCKSPNIVTLRLGVGSVLPMELTSIGRAYLWALPPRERQRLLFGLLKRAGAKGPELVTRIESAFDHLDKHGYCTSIGEYQRDSYGLSVPLQVGSPPFLMSLNCGAVWREPPHALIENVLAPKLQKMARALTKALLTADSTLF